MIIFVIVSVFAVFSSSCFQQSSNPVAVDLPHYSKKQLGLPPEDLHPLAMAALEIIDPTIIYDPAYTKIPYPNGDVDPQRGVCTDVIIRAYRKLGIDLQKEVHQDMKGNFIKYPQRWGRKGPDSNIDHRRVPNLMTFFSRHGEVLPITKQSKDYQSGDIVCWDLGGGTLHIGIVVDSNNIVHNIGRGQIKENCLFYWKIIGHYAYPK